MKKILFVSIVILCTVKLFPFEFELMPLNINYYGAVSAGNNTIVYGDYGSYLLSSNNGGSWKQYSLNEYGKIRKIVNYKDTLYGVIQEGLIIQSNDKGFSWNKYCLKSNDSINYVNILVDEELIFIRTSCGIEVYDKKMKLKKIVEDSIFKVHFFSRKIGNVPESIVLPYEMFNFMDKILLNVHYNYIDGMAIFDKSTFKYDTINLRKKIYLNDKNRLLYYHLNNVLLIDDNPILVINGMIYKTDSKLENISYFFQDTSYLNLNDSIQSRLNGHFQTYNYFINDNKLYVPSNVDNKNYKLLVSQNITSLGGGELGQFGIYEYNSDKSRFVLKGNYFNNKYITPTAQNDWEKESTLSKVYYSQNHITNSNDIIKAGIFKTILKSKNNFSDWELISSLNAQPKYIMNDSTYYFVNNDKCMNDICRSSNYGSTFKPAELGYDIDTNIKITKYYDKDSILHIDTVYSIDTVSYFSRFTSTELFYIDSTGFGFWAGPLEMPSHNKVNFAFTKNAGQNYKFIKVNEIWPAYRDIGCTNSNIVRVNDLFLYSFNVIDTTINGKYYHSKNILDINFNGYQIASDSLYYIHYFVADNLKNYYMLTSAQDKDDLNKIRFEIRETNDSGKTSNTICSIDKELFLDQIYEHNMDSIFFTTSQPAELYLYDRKNNKINQLYQASQDDTLKIMYLSNKYYLLGNNLFRENTDKSDLTKWKDSDWDYGRPSFSNLIFKGNVAIACLEDSLRKKNYYRILPKVMPVSVTNDTEVKYGKHFYASASYPMPGKNVVRSRISYDESFDLEESLNGVYNTYGERIEGKENLRVIKWGHAQAEIEWNCSHAPSGVYFIIVKHNGRNDCVPVIVER